MASTRRKLFVVSEDSIVVGNILKWAATCDHEVKINSTIPENASVVDLNAVNFIIIDGNLAHEDDYDFLELVSKNTPVVVISDINNDNSDKMNAEALKKGAIDYWYPPIDKETYDKIESLILGKKSLSTSNKRKSEVVENIKIFVVSEDSIVVQNIHNWAGICNHEVTINSTIPENASVDFNAVDFIIVDGNLAHEDGYNFLEIVSKNTPVVVISDINDNNSDKKNVEALEKGAIDYWYPPIDQKTYNKIESLILGKKSLSTSKKRKAKVEGETSSEVQGIEDKKRVNDSPPAGLYPIEGGGSIRYVDTPRPPKKP